MKNTRYLVVFFLFLASCAPNPAKQAAELLEKSIQAHGGEAGWNKLRAIKFKKMTRLWNDSGQLESELIQWHEFQLVPFLEGKITWEKDSIPHLLTWDGAKIRYRMGSNEVENADFLEVKKKEFDAAYYTVAQPWKLLDKGGNLFYEGKKTLENGKEVEAIRVDYGPDTDTWWYYFDPLTFLMIGTEVQLKDHRSLIYDLSVEKAEGLVLHGKRESWRVDESGKRLFLRAEYAYSAYELVY